MSTTTSFNHLASILGGDLQDMIENYQWPASHTNIRETFTQLVMNRIPTELNNSEIDDQTIAQVEEFIIAAYQETVATIEKIHQWALKNM